MSAPNLKRNLEIVKRYNKQKIKNRAELARIYNISRPRIWQICQEAEEREQRSKNLDKMSVRVGVDK